MEIKYINHPGFYVNDLISVDKDLKKLLINSIGNEKLNDLIEEKIDINYSLAKSLEYSTGIKTDTWFELQKEYDKSINLKMYKRKKFLNEYRINAIKLLRTFILLFYLLIFLIYFLIKMTIILFPIFKFDNIFHIFLYYFALIIILPASMMIERRIIKKEYKVIKYLLRKIKEDEGELNRNGNVIKRDYDYRVLKNKKR